MNRTTLTFALLLALGAGVALAQVAHIYEPSQTHLAPCVQLCKVGSAFTMAGTCVTADADGGSTRAYDVTGAGATVAATFASLQSACVP